MSDPATRQQRAQLNNIMAGAEAGHYTLPAALHAALRAEAYVKTQLAEARGRQLALGVLDGTIEALAQEVVDAAGAGKPLADLAERIAQAEAAERLARLEMSVLEMATDAASSRVIYGTRGATIIAEHLRPALVETLATVRAAAPKLGNVDPARPETALRASEASRKALVAIEDAVVRYQALRRARWAAATLDGGPAHDTAGWYAELRQPDALNVPLGGPADRPMPWPEHPAARLIWLATVAAEQTWMPTPAEQDQAFAEWNERTRSKRPRPVSLVAGGF